MGDEKVYQTYQQHIAKYPIQFDKIFISTQEQIFVLNVNGMENEIPISNDCLSQLKKETLKKTNKIDNR